MNLSAIPAFQDNYIWLLTHAGRAWVVDPGEASPVLSELARQQLVLEGILITHHHGDHTGGVPELLAEFAQVRVYGPANEALRFDYHPLQEGATIEIFDTAVEIIDVPGHTAGHIAYWLNPSSQSPILFCGDTLFSGGCGRLFEGTAAQMHESLRKLASRAPQTRVCCAHEYTLSNLRFAAAVEPENTALQAHIQQCEAQRAQGLSTLPSSIDIELKINPFLRCAEPEVVASAAARAGKPLAAPSEVLGTLREWKNAF